MCCRTRSVVTAACEGCSNGCGPTAVMPPHQRHRAAATVVARRRQSFRLMRTCCCLCCSYSSCADSKQFQAQSRTEKRLLDEVSPNSAGDKDTVAAVALLEETPCNNRLSGCILALVDIPVVEKPPTSVAAMHSIKTPLLVRNNNWDRRPIAARGAVLLGSPKLLLSTGPICFPSALQVILVLIISLCSLQC